MGGTIGPKGRNVYFEDPNALQPTITNDGFVIAANIQLSDKLQDAGAFVIRNVSSQQNDDAGDGTTTVAVLTQALICECVMRPENAMVIKQSLKEAGDKALKALAKTAVKLKPGEVEKVALISSEDKHIAKLITEIIEKLGDKAVVNVEDSKTFATEYEIIDGYEAHIGFMSPHFVTDKKTGKAVYEDVPILLIESKVSNLADITPIFEMFKREGINKCVIVAADMDDSMLGVFVNSKLAGTFSSVVIRATGWLLMDIEGATGGRMISDSTNINAKNFKKEYLGYAKKVICNANTTLFTTDGAAGKAYASILEMQAENDPNQFQAKKLKERAAKLRGGMATLRIGASTDFERDYLRRKAEDSVKAVQAALEEGVVEGGGMALWRIAEEINPKTIGEEILKKALKAPLRKIIENAGQDYSDIVGEINATFNGTALFGYDAKAGEVVDLMAAGIIDPFKVTRCAFGKFR